MSSERPQEGQIRHSHGQSFTAGPSTWSGGIWGNPGLGGSIGNGVEDMTRGRGEYPEFRSQGDC